MPDTPFRRVDPGQPLEISARDWNALTESTREFQRYKRGRTDSAPASGIRVDPQTPATYALVKWETFGPSVPEFGVVAYGAPVILPTDNPTSFEVSDLPVFVGVTPATSNDLIMLLTEPVETNAYGRAVTSGVAVVDIDITDITHTHGVPIAGDITKLASAASGRQVLILYKPAGLGVKRCIVMLDITGDSSGAASIWCADYATQSYWEPIAASGFSRNLITLDSVYASEGFEVYDYQTGSKSYLPIWTDTLTGKFANVVCIPPNSGTWVARFGAWIAHLNDHDLTSYGGYFGVATTVQVVAVDADGLETEYLDGENNPLAAFPDYPIPVVSGQIIERPGGSGAADLIYLGDASNTALVTFSESAGSYGQIQRATGFHEKAVVSGDETIRLALKFVTKWKFGTVPPDPESVDWKIFQTYILGWGQGGTGITIEQVSTANCVSCGSGSGSGSGSGDAPSCCEEALADHPNLTMVIPDGPYVGSYTGVWTGAVWRFSDLETLVVARVRTSCSAGVWTLEGAPATAQDCDPFLVTFDGAIYGATGDITLEVAP